MGRNNIYRQAAERAFNSLDHKDELVVWDVYKKLLNDYYDPIIVDVIFQNHFDSLDPVDAYSFAQVYGLMLSGKIAMCVVGLIEAPERDKEIQINNQKLAKLQPPFSATFTGGSGDDDGTFAWGEEIICSTNYQNTLSDYRIPPESVPLEVGTTAAERTFAHIVTEMAGVARWPYGHDRIHVLIPTRELVDNRLASIVV